MDKAQTPNEGNERSGKDDPADQPEYYTHFSDRILAAIEEEGTVLSFLFKFGDVEKGVASAIRVRGHTPEDALQDLHEMLSDFQQYEGTNTHDYSAVEYLHIHFWPRHVYPEDVVWSETRIV